MEGGFVAGDEGEFFIARPCLDLMLALLRFGSRQACFLMNKLHRKAGTGASAAFLAVMFFYSTIYIGRAAGVQNTVSTSQYVDVPHKSPLLNDGPSTRPPWFDAFAYRKQQLTCSPQVGGLARGQFSSRKDLSTIKQQRGLFTLIIGSAVRKQNAFTQALRSNGLFICALEGSVCR